MIDVITSGKNVKKMVSFHFQKEKSILISTNMIYDETQQGITKAIFKRNKTNEGRVKNPNIHISLNFHKDDKEEIDSNPFFLQAIADEYMEKMGYGDQPYAVFRHDDKEHPHIHIISTRINEEGKKIKDSFEKRKSGRITEALERKHDLTIAKEHGKHYVKYEEKDLPELIKNHIEKGEKPLIKILENCIVYALEKLPIDEEDYRKRLQQYGVDFREADYDYLYFLKVHNAEVLSSKAIVYKAKNKEILKRMFTENKAKSRLK